MRIVIDMQGAQTESRFRGIGRYTIDFVQAVTRNRGKHEIILVLSGLFPETIESFRAVFDGLLPQENIRVWQAPSPVRESQSGNKTRRETAELIRESFLVSLQPDVIHISSLFEGYEDDAITSLGSFDKSTPVSVTVYDLIPFQNPDEYLKSNKDYEQYYLRKVEHLRRASLFLAISNFSRNEVCGVLDVAKDKVINVSTAVDPQFKPLTKYEAAADDSLQKFAITQPFILYTGGADERKNLPRLIEAYAQLASEVRERHQLVFAGKMHESVVEQLNQLAICNGLKTGELIFTGYISDQQLVKFYNFCKLYVFPSWHEGFGLPALEAMACGAPVIGANTSSLPEVIGLDEALFDPFDVSDIFHKIDKALRDDSFRERLHEHGLQQANKFSWDETAKKAIHAWTELSAVPSPQLFIEDNKPIQKPRLAFVSPLPPERTGIANYSKELLPFLAEYYDIELVVAQEKVEESLDVKYGDIHDTQWLYANVHNIDRVLYQVGNSPFHAHMLSLLEDIPGTVVLHDFYMSGLMSWLELRGGGSSSWTQAIYDSHGYIALSDRFHDLEKAYRLYPANWHILQNARGVIVHSEFSKSLAHKWYDNDISSNWVVIALLRSQSSRADKQSIRSKMKIDADDFVVCSFGFLDNTKLNHRLLQAWLESALANDKHCHLVFVGENTDGEYGVRLLKTIRESNLGSRVHITGYASPETYSDYLVAADLAVQLRGNSRGETSAAVLDCMNYGLPTIVNANGSMAELDSEAVWMLSDEFKDHELINALQSLWRDPERRKLLGDRARTIIMNCHAPNECAKLYTEAIERFYLHSETDQHALINAITNQRSFTSDQTELIELSQSIATNLPLTRTSKRLFLDITATCREDLKTGIERVARALLMTLIESPPKGYRIEPVYLHEFDGTRLHRYARNYTLGLLGCPADAMIDEPIDPQNGDVMLILDISGDALVQAEQAGLFQRYRDYGVTVYSIIYDLLPILMPKVFPSGADENHAKWLRAVSNFDGAICISKAVAEDLAAWQGANVINRQERRKYHIEWWHLGSDVVSSAPTSGMSDDSDNILIHLNSRPSFLMVGTIEPRKGYIQTIGAFTKLWQEGADINLVIVAKEGWKGIPDSLRRDIPETVKCLLTHPQLNKHLFWLEGTSDEYLEKVYSTSTCLIAASYGEGFGLPLIEAAQHKLPIIARDIPVFREVAGDYAFYFKGMNSEPLAYAITEWLELYKMKKHPCSKNMPKLTWKESADELLKLIVE